MVIALFSLDQVWENKSRNMLNVEHLLSEISEKRVQWGIFPEMTLTGFTMNANEVGEYLEDSTTLLFFKEQARKHSMYISFGMVVKESIGLFNRLITLNPLGEIISNYSKIHPFSFAGENNHYMSGETIVCSDVLEARVGMSICYDLRFPELSQILSTRTQVILNIANWPQKRVGHWKCLLQARAIENQVYYIGVNRIGVDGNGLKYTKSSDVFSPDGLKLVPEFTSEQIDIYTLNIDEVAECRKTFPVRDDRKTILYKSLL